MPDFGKFSAKFLRLQALGFDASKRIPFSSSIRVGCSQCEAASINGVACHETGCPNVPRTCRECGNNVPRGAECCA